MSLLFAFDGLTGAERASQDAMRMGSRHGFARLHLLSVREAKIDAKHKEGVLTVTLPKMAAARRAQARERMRKTHVQLVSFTISRSSASSLSEASRSSRLVPSHVS